MSLVPVNRIARAAAVVVLAVCFVLVVGTGVGFIVGERGGTSSGQAGVTLSGGGVVIEACVGRGIGRVVIQRGANDVGGPVVWTAKSTGLAVDSVPVSSEVEGYTVAAHAGSLDSGATYAVRVLTDSAGRPMIDSYLEFRPRDLKPGLITLTDGHQVTVDAFRAGKPPCR